MADAFVVGGVRSPVGRYGGGLSHIRVDDLLGRTMVAACERVGVPLARIEDITAGCVNVAHEGMGDIARWGALAAGFPDSVPAITVNRFCASSLSGAISIAHAIRAEELSVGLASGVESMSRSGWALMKGDAPFSPRGPVFMLDTMWAGAGGPAEHAPDAGRYLLAPEGRRERRGARKRRGRRGARRRAVGACHVLGHARARPAGDGDRAGVRDPEGARTRRPGARGCRRL